MRKFNYVCSVILVIAMALAVVLMSSNIVLRLSGTYMYHFNDSEAVDKISYNVTNSEMSKAVASYLSSFSGDDFQVYENNGQYRDPVFKADEQAVMKKVKMIVNLELAAGLICLAIALAVYVYLFKGNFKDALRRRYYTGLFVSVCLLIAELVLVGLVGVRKWLYSSLIGISLPKDSTLATILGDPFFKTYILWTAVLTVAILGFLTYVNQKLTKPERIFY